MRPRILGPIFLLVAHASLLAQRNSKLAPELMNVSRQPAVNVIVQFTETPTARHHQKIVSRGGTVHRVLGLIKAGSYSIPPSALASLAHDPDVVYISPDRPLFSTNNGSATAVLDYHTETVNATAAWAQGLNGSGIGVAVIDSGPERTRRYDRERTRFR